MPLFTDADLIRQWRATQDVKVRNELVMRHIKGLHMVAYEHRHNESIEHGDYLAEGVIGFIRAIDLYDIDGEVPFFNYAIKMANFYMMNYYNGNRARGICLRTRTQKDEAAVVAAGRKVAQYEENPKEEGFTLPSGLAENPVYDTVEDEAIKAKLHEFLINICTEKDRQTIVYKGLDYYEKATYLKDVAKVSQQRMAQRYPVILKKLKEHFHEQHHNCQNNTGR